MQSDDSDWKDNDPELPQGSWWFSTDPSRMVGFRMVKSLTPLDLEKIDRFWHIDDEDTKTAVESALQMGRTVEGLAVPDILDHIE